MSNKKIPIDEYGRGNCCPECGSVKILVFYQYPLYVYENLRTGKEVIKINGKRISRPTNRLLAEIYKSSQLDAQCWNYECENCGWQSKLFVP